MLGAIMSKAESVRKYKQKNMKQIAIHFYPKDHDLYEAIKERGRKEGNITKFIIEALRAEIESPRVCLNAPETEENE